MNKISGILPTSSRIESVDLRNERPLRPGAASFGQPVLESTDRASAIQKETVGGLGAEDFDRTLKKPGPKSDTDIATELSNAFFMKNREREPAVVDEMAEEQQTGLSIYA